MFQRKVSNTQSSLAVAIAGAALVLSAASFAAHPNHAGSSNEPSAQQEVSQHDYQAGKARADKRLKRLAKKLDLTDEQVSQLKSRMAEDQKSTLSRRKAMQATRMELNEAASSGASESQIHAIADRLGDLIAEKAIARAKRQAAMNKILTPEQQEKFAKLQKKMRDRQAKKDKKRQAQQ